MGLLLRSVTKAYDWEHASKADLMALRDRSQLTSEGWIALWEKAAYIDVMSRASCREVESEK